LVSEREDLFAYYAGQHEGQRLFRFRHNRLELLRTRQLLRRQLPSPPAVCSTWAAGLTAEIAAKLVPVLSTGVHDPTLGFTDAFFRTTAQLQLEVAEAGFADVLVLGIEGRPGPLSTRPVTTPTRASIARCAAPS
jgi:hypothetical protein